MNVSISAIFLLLVSGAVSSALLSSGHFIPSFASIALTALALYYLERREKNSQAILRDKPVY
jgi:hypothetical protein